MIKENVRRRPFVARCVFALSFLGVFSFCILECNCLHSDSPARAAYPQEIGRINFAIAGDVIPHGAVVRSAEAAERIEAAPAAAPIGAPGGAASAPVLQAAASINHRGWDALFAEVADTFRQADYGFVNLETPIAPNHSLGTKEFMFNAPVALLEALKASGIKIVSFANNHVFDQGRAGFNESLNHLQEDGLLFAGSGATAEAAWKPVIIQKNGVRVGWLAMTRWLNGSHNPEKDSEPHVAFFPYPGEAKNADGLDEAGVLAAIKAARAECDFLAVSIHWGIEYSPTPGAEDVETAHKMLEAGAGVVIGHHPHVLQRIENYQTADHRKTVILYSLGNFLSNQSATYTNGVMPDKEGDPRDALVAKFSVVKKDYGQAGIQFEMADVGIIPAWGENNRLRVESGLDKAIFIHPVLIDREIPRIQAHLDELSRPGRDLSPEEKREFKRLTDLVALLKHRRELILARTGGENVISPPPLP
jgi:poly-gamma-glutamate capsule biosynthesis protein CapA/YwtB (metallophosphatase superfamily)